MSARRHLSIGEVLSLVQGDFPDVTISKIRFLEAQGLLDPERTPSGYRKFYPADIERLQWILIQQRDNFLPLKVIGERLAEWDATGERPDADSPMTPGEAPPDPGPTADTAPTDDPGPDRPTAGDHGAVDPGAVDPVSDVDAGSAGDAPPPGDGPETRDPADDVSSGDLPAAGDAASPSGGESPGGADAHGSVDVGPATEDVGARRAAAASLAAASAMEVTPPEASAPEPETSPDTGGEVAQDEATATPPRPSTVSGAWTVGGVERAPGPVRDPDAALTREELAELSGVAPSLVDELASYAMISSMRIGADEYFSPSCARVIDACRRFLDAGIEVRHLRMYKVAAEREAGVFEQLVMPLLKQRNPQARAEARQIVQELSVAGATLHEVMLAAVLSDSLPSS